MPCFDCEMYWNKIFEKLFLIRIVLILMREKFKSYGLLRKRNISPAKSETYDTCPKIDSSFTTNYVRVLNN